MHESPDRVHFASHTLARLIRRGGRRNEKLERDVLFDLEITRRVDDRHPTATKLTGDAISPGEERALGEVPAPDHGRAGGSFSARRFDIPT